MPNHIHGIIIIECPVGNGPARSVNKNNNLSVIIGSYKSIVTKQINQIINPSFQWQINNPRTWNNDENNPINYKVTVQAGLNPTGQF